MLSNAIESAQKRVESRNFQTRKTVLEYDDVMNTQRGVIYKQRRQVLDGEDIQASIENMLVSSVSGLSGHAGERGHLSAEEFKQATDHLVGVYTPAQLLELQKQAADIPVSQLEDRMIELAKENYAKREQFINEAMAPLMRDGKPGMRELERVILLRVVDEFWMDHIDAMQELRQGIGLRAIGQKDPAAAYANEGFDMFEEMIGEIQQETVKYCYNVTVRTNTHRRSVIGHGDARKDEYRGDAASLARRAAQEAPAGGGMAAAGQMPGAALEEVKKQETVRRQTPKIGRNDDCPCGSGKKYKNCCMKKDMMQ